MAKDRLSWIREGKTLTTRQQLFCIIQLSIPAIFAQLSTVAMEYIDASMVGRLGKNPSASIGLVTSSTWLIGGITCALGIGFTVQVAHKIGANEDASARSVVKHGLISVLIFSILMMLLSLGISGYLPSWLGGIEDIRRDATDYFRIYSLALPMMSVRYVAGGMLQSSGNMKTPSIINIFMCVLDVIYNAVFIFPTRSVAVFGTSVTVFGANLGVKGAALGTGLAEFTCGIIMLYFLLVKSSTLHIRKEKVKSDFWNELKYAVKISLPIAIENAISGSAQVVSTRIVSPLGNASIAANAFSVTAEGLCYMPGYGISSAAVALIGQSVGAKRYKETRKLSFLTIGLGMAVMTFTGILMFVLAPQMLGILTPVKEIQDLGVKVLRIEAFAEPFFAAAIVTAGAFRGIGKTTISTILNLSTMWLIRLPLAAFLASKFGLQGVWSAMCVQLIVCGSLFLISIYTYFRKQKNNSALVDKA